MNTQPRQYSGARRTRVLFRLAVLFAGTCLIPACQKAGELSDYQPRIAPAISSTQLVETEVMPTLDTPLDAAGNAVWCAPFEAAWNRLRDDVIGEPLRIAHAQPTADRLNDSPLTEAALPPGSYFAAAGQIEDGITRQIQREMTRQFPGVALPDFDGAVGFVTYGYLDTTAAFTTPFSDTPQPIEFAGADGLAHKVNGFGLYPGTDWDLLGRQAGQVKVLFLQTDDNAEAPVAFALDLTADQAEQQVIVAVLPRAEHLRAALNDLAGRIETFASEDEYAGRLQTIDALAIPNIVFHLNHEFTELQGSEKTIENAGEFQGLYLSRAAQSIGFRLDKSGATVISETNTVAAAIPRTFIVNRPFLVVMKQRQADQPYFVAWIENTELLETSH